MSIRMIVAVDGDDVQYFLHVESPDGDLLLLMQSKVSCFVKNNAM